MPTVLPDVAWYISAGQQIVSALPTVGRWVAEFLNGVTNIKQVRNLTSQPLVLWKVDKKPLQPDTQELTVGPTGQTGQSTEFWVPWADEAAGYADHHMTLRLGDNTFAWIWQDRGVMRFSNAAGYIPDGTRVPAIPLTGEKKLPSEGGGDRTLIVQIVEGQPAFAFGGMQVKG